MAARDDESRDDERARYGPARSSRSLLGSCTLYSSVPASGLGTPGSVISLLLSSPSLSTSGPVPSRSGLRAMRHQVSTVCILEITIRVRFAFVYIFLVGNERLTRRRATDLRVVRLTGADDRTSAAPTRRGGALYCSSRLPVRAAHATRHRCMDGTYSMRRSRRAAPITCLNQLTYVCTVSYSSTCTNSYNDTRLTIHVERAPRRAGSCRADVLRPCRAETRLVRKHGACHRMRKYNHKMPPPPQAGLVERPPVASASVTKRFACFSRIRMDGPALAESGCGPGSTPPSRRCGLSGHS